MVLTLPTLIGVVMVRAESVRSGIDEAVEELLQCVLLKDAECISELAAHPGQLHVQMSAGSRELVPYFVEDVFSEQSKISLYQVATTRSKYSWRAFRVSQSHYEVVFFKNGSISANAPYSDFAKYVGQSEAIQCGYLYVDSEWKLSDSICGYIDDGNGAE